MPVRSTGMMRQEWEPVVLQKPKMKAHDLRDPKAVNQALLTGAQVQTVKKSEAGSNRKTPATAVNFRKLDEAAEPATLEKVAVDVRLAIQKARIEKKLSQADLAKQINERTQCWNLKKKKIPQNFNSSIFFISFLREFEGLLQ